MKIDVHPGVYVVAVSGGVDSMSLLDIVRQVPGVELVVAHVNHGIREDAAEDAKLVQAYAMSHNLTYETTTLTLGKDTSEEEARDKRYEFLRHIRQKYNAVAILTAHHRDDVLETAIINMLRGTGWRGLCSLRSTGEIIRPLLAVPKQELVDYATQRGLPWRHDSTNNNDRYLRNYIRHQIMPKMSAENVQQLYKYIVRQNELVEQIDAGVDAWLRANASLRPNAVSLPRYDLIMMPRHVAHEILQGVLRQISGKSAVRPLVERALLFAKVAKACKIFPINARVYIAAQPDQVIVQQGSSVVS